jgi:signal transduction histidine kinase
MNKRFNILYVDDEVSNLNIFKNTFRRDYNVYTAVSAQEGLKILDCEKIDLILTDQRMPEMSGVEFLKNVMVKYPQPSRILITAYTDFDALKDAVNDAKIFQYIQKPWDEKETQQIINNALEIYQLKQKNDELTQKLKHNNDELNRLNNELLELDKLKFQFLSIISHEIRTPLNGLIGATSLFQSKLSNEDSRYQELFQMLELSTQRLEHFLLLAERITAFKAKIYTIKHSVVQINELISDVVKHLHNKISDKNIRIEYEMQDEVGRNCFADKQLLGICLMEVIDNAIKYSHENSEVLIRAYTREQNQVIEVIDDGPGFPEIVLKHIYKAFVTDEDITKQGMGLDLALIKLIIEAHNGTIEIKNNEIRGATVRLVFKMCELVN